MRHKVSSIHRFSMGVGLGKYITTSMTTLVNHSLKTSPTKKCLFQKMEEFSQMRNAVKSIWNKKHSFWKNVILWV